MKAITKISITGKSNNHYGACMALHRNTFKHSCGGETGFTLMELIIVCTLAGLFLSISIPTLRNNLYVNQLDTTARKIMGTVQELRNLAVRDHKAYLLHFDIGESEYWHEADDTINPFGDEPKTVSSLPEGVRFSDVQTHFQGTNTSGVVTLWISKQGYMDQTVVHLSDDGGKSLTLMFSPFSGSARVYDDYVEAE